MPKNVRGLVERFGADEVYEASFKVLGYPILYVTDVAEVNQISMFLFNRERVIDYEFCY